MVAATAAPGSPAATIRRSCRASRLVRSHVAVLRTIVVPGNDFRYAEPAASGGRASAHGLSVPAQSLTIEVSW